MREFRRPLARLIIALVTCMAGCHTTTRTISADTKPDDRVYLDHFALHDDCVEVFGDVVAGPMAFAKSAKVYENGSVEIEGFNALQRWRLKSVLPGRATFIVDSKWYGCCDIFAIMFGIPTSTSHETVIVVFDRAASTANATSQPSE